MEIATRKNKKVDKREAFTEVFERQARRFSAFDLLGIEPSPPSPSPSTPKNLNSREGESKSLVKAIEVENIEPDDSEQRTITCPSQVHRTGGIVQVHRTDRENSFEISDTELDKAGTVQLANSSHRG